MSGTYTSGRRISGRRISKKRNQGSSRAIRLAILLIIAAALIGGVVWGAFSLLSSLSSDRALAKMLDNSDFSEAAKYISQEGENEKIDKTLSSFAEKYIAYCASSDFSQDKWSEKYGQLGELGDKIKPALVSGMEAQIALLCSGAADTASVTSAVERIGGLPFTAEALLAAQGDILAVDTSKQAFARATSLFDGKDYKAALQELSLVVEKDSANYKSAQEKIEVCKTEYLQSELNAAKALFDGAKYTEAYNMILELNKMLPNDAAITALAAEYLEAVNKHDLVDFPTSDIYHLFTHCLIAFPELSIKQPNGGSYDIDCIDVLEFSRVLDQLYSRNYMLIDINILFEQYEDGGVQKVKLKPSIKVPKGKIPLIFSFDDVTYDSRKMGKGMVDKLVIKDGRIQTYTKMTDGTELYSTENEFIPILDDFVAAHPDFSFNGAKATLNLTGFEGILGYRTQSDSPNRESEIAAVAPVVQMLKDTGYTFASHGYGHRRMETTSAATWEEDTAKWRAEVGSLVGDTDIYVYPYGSWTKYDTPQHQSLLKHSFKVFCGVGGKKYMINGMPPASRDVGNAFMDRRPIDGFSLRERYTAYSDMLDTYAVYDHDNRSVAFPKP